MKLPEHVDTLRDQIEAAFDKYCARLGVGKAKKLDIDRIPEEIRPKRLRFEDMLENHIGETGDYEHAREKLIDELTFTLFNRLAAVKVMEAASLFPPILTKQPEHGDRSFGHKAWLEIRPDMRSEELEGIREYIKHAFDELGETLPLYHRDYPYALLPDTISLNEIIESFNAVENDPQVGEDIWQSDDVLGWLYESYNNRKKQAHKDSKAKTEFNKVSLQSQVYTPRWVVQFLVENSLGKLYLEMFPDSEIKRNHKIANAPATQTRKPKPLHEIKVVDPACGSGNFLLYAFDLFHEFYVDQIDNYGADYEEKDIPQLIIENNLHGIDLDDRAVQLAQLGLLIKAKKKRRNIGMLAFKVVSSDFFLPPYEEVSHIFESGSELESGQRELIADIWEDLQSAYKFGSLIRLDTKLKSRLRARQKDVDAGKYPLMAGMAIDQEKDFAASFFENLKGAVEKYAKSEEGSFLASKTRDAITFLELLATEYDVATANPPYTDSADFGPDLKKFIENNYKKPHKFHTNLYATFINCCYDLTNGDGKIAMIHPHTFMFIKTFEGVRKFMIDKCHVDIMVDFGLDRVNLFGPGILLDATFYVLSKGESSTDGVYFNLTANLQEKFKKQVFLQALTEHASGESNSRVYTLEQSKLKTIKSWPFIYWISDEFREKFKGELVKDVLKNCQGLKTANNNRFLRFWWELSTGSETEDVERWFSYAKGGPYKKWSGNLWLKVNWESNGSEIKGFVDSKGKQKSRPQNEKYYFKEGVTYSASGSKGPSFRALPASCLFDGGGSSIFPEKYSDTRYMLAFFNSKLCSYIADCLNPTVNINPGDLDRVPFVVPSSAMESKIISIVDDILKKEDHILEQRLLEEKYTLSPYLWDGGVKAFLNFENAMTSHVLVGEAIIDETVFNIYELNEHDKDIILSKEGKSVGSLPVSLEAKRAYLNEKHAENDIITDSVRSFIEDLPTKNFSSEEKADLERDFSSLYQKNNDFEEFCIRNKVNPINVWYWFKYNNITPQQRVQTLAMEFIVDMVREILLEDEDGIIPLVPNAGEKVLIDRIEDKFREKGLSSALYSSFDTVLGRPIYEYLNRCLFAELSDHLNLFMHLPKTPFIWHLSSGPEQGFDCYLIIYKWSRDNLMRLRSVYIEHRERSLVNRQSDLADNDSAEAQNEKDKIFKQLKEIEDFKAKIDELLAEGYDPVLDDGVGKNIAPLQKKKMIPYEVLNAGQLKKYLNADW